MKARRRVLDAHDSTPTIRTNLPCAIARADPAREPFLRVAVLEIVGVELDRLARFDRQHDRTVRFSLVVDGLDAYLARLVGVVDDPHQPQPVQCISRRREKRNRLRSLRYLCGRRSDAEPDNRCRERIPRHTPVETVHLRIVPSSYVRNRCAGQSAELGLLVRRPIQLACNHLEAEARDGDKGAPTGRTSTLGTRSIDSDGNLPPQTVPPANPTPT